MSDDTDFDDLEEIGQDTASEFESVLAGFDLTDSNVTYEIRVYRIASKENVKGQRESYLFSVTPTELPILIVSAMNTGREFIVFECMNIRAANQF